MFVFDTPLNTILKAASTACAFMWRNVALHCQLQIEENIEVSRVTYVVLVWLLVCDPATYIPVCVFQPI